jgi:hypothetical protein
MAFRLLAKKVFQTAVNLCGTTNIGTGTSGIQLVTTAAQLGTVEAIQFYNGSTSVIALCTGTPAVPVVKVLCGPGLSDIIPTEGIFPKGSGIVAVAQDTAATTGTFAVNLLAG